MKEALPHEKQILEYKETIEKFKKQNKGDPLFEVEIKKLEAKLGQLKERVYSNLSPWERVTICRHPSRPHTIDYLTSLCSGFREISGDRLYGDDRAIRGGFAYIGDQKFMVLGQEKGHDIASRVEANFGSMHPEGFRKALRMMKLAEKFQLPILSIVDTQGAFPGLEAEERGQGRAIAHNLLEMSQLRTPIIVLIIGEGASGGALGIGVGDVIGMLQHAFYSVISPEGCASILWKDPEKKKKASDALKLNAEYLLEFGVIDEMIPEPLGGAHHDPQSLFESVQEFVLRSWEELKEIPLSDLVERRYEKFRKMGRVRESTNIHSITEADQAS